MQKPTLCIYQTTHVLQHARVYKHPWASTTTCFRRLFIESSYVSESQKQAFSKRLKICLLPHPDASCRHPSVSLRVQRYTKKMTLANKSAIFMHFCIFLFFYITVFTLSVPAVVFYVRAGQEVIPFLSHAFLLAGVSCPASKAYILLPSLAITSD